MGSRIVEGSFGAHFRNTSRPFTLLRMLINSLLCRQTCCQLIFVISICQQTILFGRYLGAAATVMRLLMMMVIYRSFIASLLGWNTRVSSSIRRRSSNKTLIWPNSQIRTLSGRHSGVSARTTRHCAVVQAANKLSTRVGAHTSRRGPMRIYTHIFGAIRTFTETHRNATTQIFTIQCRSIHEFSIWMHFLVVRSVIFLEFGVWNDRLLLHLLRKRVRDLLRRICALRRPMTFK